MHIESTVYVHRNILEMLNRGAAITGKSRTVIIKLLMKRVMSQSRRMIKSYSRLRYQKRDPEKNWHRLHISFNECEYEYCLDIRKFYKMSVSFIIAYAAQKYLNEIMKILIKGDNTDNYRFRNYIFTHKILDGAICWQIYWGIPVNPSLLLSQIPFDMR